MAGHPRHDGSSGLHKSQIRAELDTSSQSGVELALENVRFRGKFQEIQQFISFRNVLFVPFRLQHSSSK